ncbi:MAG: magnesium transporter [Sedimentisphaeraceae bacterium JB056]
MAEVDIKDLVQQVRDLLETGSDAALRELFEEQRTSDIAEIVEYLGADEGSLVFNFLPHEEAAEVFEKIHESIRHELYDVLDSDYLKQIILELDLDDAADILSELPVEDTQELLKNMEPEESAKIRDLMRYSEDSAGGIMDPVLLALRGNQTVAEAIRQIRDHEIDEDFFAVFVTDRDGRYLGDVRIRSLITSKPDTPLKDLIEEDEFFVRVSDDQEEIRNIFSKNDLIVVPVVDESGFLVGRITADRVIEVAEEEAAEDIYAMAGTDAGERELPSAFNAARVRMTWLLPCMLGTGITAAVMLTFQRSFSEVYLVAAAFAPMIGAISGNAGLQTSAIVVCGLATGHLAANKISQVFLRETRIAALVALCCGIVGGVIYSLLSGRVGHELPMGVSLIQTTVAFGLSMFMAIIVSTTLGLSLPFLFKKVGIDPAISSGPLVTTANDSISVTIYMLTTLFFMSLS